MDYEIKGYALLSAQVKTVGDLRELIKQFDNWQIRDDCDLDWGHGELFVELADSSRGDLVEPIGCGDHAPTRNADGEFLDPIDFVITAHQCSRNEPEKYNGPENYEEALEESLPPEPPSYQARASLTDWLLGNNDNWRGPDYAR